MRATLLSVFATMLVTTHLGVGVASAGGGVREINQTCAAQTGCFAGDAPGFPVTITESGAYALTGNLAIGGTLDADEVGISVETNHVDLDLRGFGIINEPAQLADRIFALQFDAPYEDLSIRNGRITAWEPFTPLELSGSHLRLSEVFLSVGSFRCGDSCTFDRVTAELFSHPTNETYLVCGDDCAILNSSITAPGADPAFDSSGTACGDRCRVHASHFRAGGAGTALATGADSVVTESTFFGYPILGERSVMRDCAMVASEGDFAFVIRDGATAKSIAVGGWASASGRSSIHDSVFNWDSISGVGSINVQSGGVVGVLNTSIRDDDVAFSGTVVDAGGNVCGDTLGCP